MKPDEKSSSQGGTQLLPQRSFLDDNQTQPVDPSQEAATKILLSKINNLIKEQGSGQISPTATTIQDTNPYQRTHKDNVEPRAADWKKYHSAWQDYYQKYYEGYYTHHLKNAQETIKQQNKYNIEPESITSTDEVVLKLRRRLLEKVRTSATKVRKSRHFIPIAAGLVVILLFMFLQYNRILISNVMAYISPGNIDIQNIIIDPNANLTVSPEPRLIIPKINVDVPVIYDIGNDYNSQMDAMTKGVAHFAIPGASSHPGEIGNTVISGHSSNDLFDPGDYKFIFAQLDKLNVGDTIYANYQSKRYTYTVTKKEIVSPTEVNKLVYPTIKPILTLITCTPLGTSLNRLLVTAEQISPDPTQSTTAPVTITTTGNSAIPGNSPTFFERLFGG